jgi:hypothetical protein
MTANKKDNPACNVWASILWFRYKRNNHCPYCFDGFSLTMVSYICCGVVIEITTVPCCSTEKVKLYIFILTGKLDVVPIDQDA